MECQSMPERDWLEMKAGREKKAISFISLSLPLIGDVDNSQFLQNFSYSYLFIYYMVIVFVLFFVPWSSEYIS